MKVFDCTTFYNENMMLELRFNILDPYVDKFVITESKYSAVSFPGLIPGTNPPLLFKSSDILFVGTVIAV